jgi:tetratricopeptide (TPR) repeat protein
MAVRLPVVAAVLATALLASPAHAAGTTRSAPTDARALDLFEQSAQAYREGRFQDAVDKLREARTYKAEPVLLYNLGRAYEALGRPGDAADAYAKYLEEDPEASDRKAIEGRVATLRAQAAELAAARREPNAPAGDDAFAFAPYVVAGVGALGLGAGVVLGVLAEDRHDDAVAEPVQATAVEEQERAESLARASTVTLVAGAVVAAMGLAWIGIRVAQPRATSRGFVLGVRF